MNKPSKILVAYDHSDLSKKALKYARKLISQDESAEIEIVTVLTFLVPYESQSMMTLKKNAKVEAYKSLEKVKAQFNKTPNKTRVRVLEGDPALKLVQYSEEKKVDIIVMGSRGLGGVKEFLLGSVSYNVVQLAKCPVFIIK